LHWLSVSARWHGNMMFRTPNIDTSGILIERWQALKILDSLIAVPFLSVLLRHMRTSWMEFGRDPARSQSV